MPESGFPSDIVPERYSQELDSIDSAIAKVTAGEMVIVVDDDEREGEGDLVIAASKASETQVAFMIRYTSGILCVPMLAERARALRLDPMVSCNDAPLQTAFTVSADYRVGLTTGIAARERAATVRALADERASATDFVRPGHIFPLIAKDSGVLVRSGHTEAAVDLARLANLPPVGLIGELVNDDGTVKRKPELLAFAQAHRLTIISVDDLISYRQRRECLLRRAGEFSVATEIGGARAIAYATPYDEPQHLALVFGDIDNGEPVPVRIHREHVISDVFGARCAGEPHALSSALTRIGRAGRGVLIYLREGSTSAAVPQESPFATLASARTSERNRLEQWRQVGVGAQILRDLGISSIVLLTTKHMHYVGLGGFGISIAELEMMI